MFDLQQLWSWKLLVIAAYLALFVFAVRLYQTKQIKHNHLGKAVVAMTGLTWIAQIGYVASVGDAAQTWVWIQWALGFLVVALAFIYILRK